MILGTKARYAVMAMVEMAGCEENQAVKLAELAARQEITIPYLEQIFKKLKLANLVKSVRGPGGGYIMARPAAEIRIYEIVEAVNESMKVTRCEAKEKAGCMTNKSRCLTHDLWDGLEKQIHDYLSAISLADIRNKNKKNFE